MNYDYQKTTYAIIVLPVLAGMEEEWLRSHSYRDYIWIKTGKIARQFEMSKDTVNKVTTSGKAGGLPLFH